MQKYSKITVSKAFTFLILALMFLCAVEVRNMGYMLLLLAFAIFIFTPERKLSLDASFLLMMAFSISMVIFNSTVRDNISTIVMAFNYPICYLMGRSLFLNSNSNENFQLVENNHKRSVYVVAIGTFVHYTLNMIINIGRTDRAVIEFWSRKELSATAQAAFACLIVGVIAATVFSNEKKKKKILAWCALVLVIMYNLVLSGRTLFVLIVIAIVVSYFYRSHAMGKKIIKSVIIFILVVSVLVICYNYNVLNVKTAFESSNFYDRFYGGDYTQEIDDDSRWENKIYYLRHFFDSMLGGGHIRKEFGRSAHDLYLDTYDESGIFALIAIVLYILASWSRLIKCLKNKVISSKTKQLMLCVYLMVNIMFFLEPVIRGIPWALYFYCFIDGSLASLLYQTQKIKQ